MKKIIAFLDQPNKKNNCFSTYAMSYGLKHFTNQDGIFAYKKKIFQFQYINTLPEGRKKESDIIDWMVSCVTDKYTRWEGLYELISRNLFCKQIRWNYN